MRPFDTQRLVLREFDSSDLKPLSELYQLEETSRYESWDPHTSVDDTQGLLEYWIACQSDEPRTDFTFAIDLSDEFIGLVGLELGFGTETDDLRAGFVGYRVHPSRWGQGYATEAVRALLAFGFDQFKLHRIHSGCVVSNAASIKVLEKAGFSEEGRTRESFPIGASWQDYAFFGILESTWRRHITCS